jgi:hypothetical protein
LEYGAVLLPILHASGFTWDEAFVWVGFAIIIYLVTSLLDRRR